MLTMLTSDDAPFLTVDQPDRVETSQKASETPSLGLIVCKWFVTVLLALIFVACLGASKLSAVHLSHTLNTTKEDGMSTDPDAVARHSSVFLMLLISLMIPYIVTLLRSIWCGGFRSDRFWPRRSAVLWVSAYTVKWVCVCACVRACVWTGVYVCVWGGG